MPVNLNSSGQGGVPNWPDRIVKMGLADVDQIMFNELNWRIHPREQYNHVEGLLDQVGNIKPIMINIREGPSWMPEERGEVLIDGHLRVVIYDKRGVKKIPATWYKFTKEEERLVLAGLDSTTGEAGTDKDKLKLLITGLKPANDGVSALLEFLAKSSQSKRPPTEEGQEGEGGIKIIKCPECGHEWEQK